jgi:hypothetical protein
MTDAKNNASGIGLDAAFEPPFKKPKTKPYRFRTILI